MQIITNFKIELLYDNGVLMGYILIVCVLVVKGYLNITQLIKLSVIHHKTSKQCYTVYLLLQLILTFPGILSIYYIYVIIEEITILIVLYD